MVEFHTKDGKFGQILSPLVGHKWDECHEKISSQALFPLSLKEFRFLANTF